jgi:hypothetical protein
MLADEIAVNLREKFKRFICVVNVSIDVNVQTVSEMGDMYASMDGVVY